MARINLIIVSYFVLFFIHFFVVKILMLIFEKPKKWFQPSMMTSVSKRWETFYNIHLSVKRSWQGARTVIRHLFSSPYRKYVTIVSFYNFSTGINYLVPFASGYNCTHSTNFLLIIKQSDVKVKVWLVRIWLEIFQPITKSSNQKRNSDWLRM